jgi:16S rRNA (guanine527-N7)-methyltransferase
LVVSAETRAQLDRLLSALAAEPDPHSTVEDPERGHIADSLVALEMDTLAGALRMADVGAGAGFPGLPLAVALPEARVDLIESARRKAATIGRLIEAADIPNARAVNARAEEWAAGEGREAYDTVVVRAVAALPVLLEYASPLLREGGRLVAWKGARDADDEEAAARAGERLAMGLVEVRPVEPYEGARNLHLHVYEKSGPTPEGFPRRPGMAAKRPLGT